MGITIAAVTAFCLYRQMDETIRERIQARFAEHYVGLVVSVQSANLIEGQGLLVRGLSIVEPGAEGPRSELLYLDEVRLACNTDLEELLRHEPQITSVLIRRPTLWVTRRADGSWSSQRLLPWPTFGCQPPTVKIEDGTVEIFDPLKAPAGTLTFRDVNLSVVPERAADGRPVLRRVKGTAGGDHFRQLALEGVVDTAGATWSLAGSVDELEVAPELRSSLPEPLSAKLAVLGSLRADGEASFRVAYDAAQPVPYQFQVAGRVMRGRVEDERFPSGLTDLRASFRAANDGYSIEDLSARSGPTTYRLGCKGSGFNATSPASVDLQVRGLELDRRVLYWLPEALEDQWYKYLPAGQVDADLALRFDGQKWKPELSARCHNVSFSYHKFPFRVEHGRGTLTLVDDLFTARLTVESGGQPIRLSAEMRGTPTAAVGWVEARGEELAIDDKLVAAMPERSRGVIRSLEPRGVCNFHYRMGRDDPAAAPRRQLTMNVSRGSMRFSKFPYPLVNIRGTLEMLDDAWTFRDFEGTNDAGRVTAEGELCPRPEGPELFLRLAGFGIPLEEELRDALRPTMQRLWNDIRPHGYVDAAANIHYVPGHNILEVEVRAEPQPQRAWIELVQFPYRLENLRGSLVYRDGQVTIERLRAEHGAAKVAGGGVCDFLPDGSWRFRLEGLSVDRLAPDRELLQALPPRLRDAIAQLNPSGPVNLRGGIEFSRGPAAEDPVQSAWDLRIGFQQGAIDCGLKLENLHGEVQLSGNFDGRSMRSRGTLAIDSLTWRDVQFTDVAGPVSIDDQQVLLGNWVARGEQAGEPPRAITAKLFGGTVYGDGWVALGPTPRYGMEATLSAADLAQCAQEVMAGRQNLKGKLLATLQLRGTGRTATGLSGHGTVRLREADIYELPLMISLLKLLSIHRPDSTAFSSSDIDFRVAGNHIYFDRLDFKGDAVSLLGKGEMDFDSQIQLTFHTQVGKHEFRIPFVKDLVGGASQQIMLIHVDGTVHDPQPRREAFPGVSQALQILGGEPVRTR